MGKIIAADLLFSSTLPSVNQYDSIAAGALGRGIDRYMAKDYTTAIREFRRSIALSPYSENALSAFEYLANALIKSGKTSEAVQTYRQAIKVFPSADGIHLSLGNLLYSQGRYTEAVEQYESAVKKNPTLSQNVYSLGEGYLALERYSDAETQFKRSIQLAPKNAGGYYALGKTYEKMGRLTEAREQLEKALSIDNSLSDAHYELGVVYTILEDINKANAELAILDEQSSLLYTQLESKINEIARPRIIAAYANGLNLAAPPKTLVSTIDSALKTPGASKNFTVSFIFDKEMDTASVTNIANWNISRSTEMRTGGLYNWGLRIPETEIRIPSMPLSVTYDPSSFIAKITFSIKQNEAGNGTIDPSHLVFKFKGTDVYGNVMDTAGDEYNRLSRVV